MIPKILFLVVHRDQDVVIHHMHNLLELFRLREVFGTHNDRVFRYMPHNKKFDLYAKFDEVKLWWDVCEDGIGFEQVSYAALESNWKYVKGLK